MGTPNADADGLWIDLKKHRRASKESYNLTSNESFPSQKEMNMFPMELQRTLQDVASDLFRGRFSPLLQRAFDRMHRNFVYQRYKDAGSEGAPMVAVPESAVNSLPYFKQLENIRELVGALRPVVHWAGEVVVFKGEPHRTGFPFLGYGYAAKRTPTNIVSSSAPMLPMPVKEPGAKPRKMPITLSDLMAAAANKDMTAVAKHPDLITAPAPLGRCTLLEEQPQENTIVIVSPIAVVWNLRYDDYMSLLAKNSLERQQSIRQLALERRVETMSEVYPLSVDYLKRYKYFSVWGDDVINLMLLKFHCRVYLPDSLIYSEGEIASSVIVVVKGVVQLGNKELRAPCVFGDLSWSQVAKRKHTATAISSVDAYVLTKDSMRSTLLKASSVDLYKQETMKDGSGGAASEAEERQTKANRYAPNVEHIPILSHILSKIENNGKLLSEISAEFSPKLYPAQTTIICSARGC